MQKKKAKDPVLVGKRSALRCSFQAQKLTWRICESFRNRAPSVTHVTSRKIWLWNFLHFLGLVFAPDGIGAGREGFKIDQQWGNSRVNIMSYFSCRDRFTPGQGDRLQATMLTERYSLISSLGDQPPSGTSVTSIDHKTVVSNPDNGSGMGPLLVKLNTLYYQSDAYRSTSKIAYEDNTCTMGTTLSKTGSYTIEVTTGLNRQRVKVWLDENDDGVYSAGELLGSSNPSGGGDFTHDIPIPSALLAAATVLNKPLRMRVAADYGSSPDYDYNSELEYGQMEDFAVTITDAVLPVQFGALTAVIRNGMLRVNWASENEVNNDRYQVQLSNDGKVFYTLGILKSRAPQGNSNTPVEYNFTIDIASASGVFGSLIILAFCSLAGNGKRKRFRLAAGCALPLLWGLNNACNKKVEVPSSNGNNALFLRIRQIDKDGTIRYSKVIKVNEE